MKNIRVLSENFSVLKVKFSICILNRRVFVKTLFAFLNKVQEFKNISPCPGQFFKPTLRDGRPDSDATSWIYIRSICRVWRKDVDAMSIQRFCSVVCPLISKQSHHENMPIKF